MFDSFLYLLRSKGLKVSMTEWMTLNEALDKGMTHASFSEFYYLCRSVLVKSESEFDKFDGEFSGGYSRGAYELAEQAAGNTGKL